MTEQEQVKAIVEKYNKRFYDLLENATAKEFKIVMTFFANASTRKQRELVG